MKTGKVIVMDYGFYLHTAGWAVSNVRHADLQVDYVCLNMMISDLKKIGLTDNDEVIVGVDYHGDDYSSWRKQFSSEYKEGRVKLEPGIYAALDELLETIKYGTEWNVVLLPHLEYDDIAAVACRHYSDREVVLVSSDCDMEQMWIYDNVKIFSPHRKMKRYKIRPNNWNIYRVLANKIKKEAKDQITSEVLNEEEYNKRKLILDLTSLPEWVEEMVTTSLKGITVSDYNLNLIAHADLIVKYDEIFTDTSKIITYEQSIAKVERKLKKALKLKKEKAHEKAVG